jgi:hypothetical protein
MGCCYCGVQCLLVTRDKADDKAVAESEFAIRCAGLSNMRSTADASLGEKFSKKVSMRTDSSKYLLFEPDLNCPDCMKPYLSIVVLNPAASGYGGVRLAPFQLPKLHLAQEINIQLFSHS